MWIALIFTDQFNQCWSSLWSSRDAVLQNVTLSNALNFWSTTHPSARAVFPQYLKPISATRLTQNATKFIKILVCTTICLTITRCSQHQWIWSSFFTRVDNEVNTSIFYIFLKEENNKLYFRLSWLCLSLLFITQGFKIISIRNPCFIYKLLPKTEGAEGWFPLATALQYFTNLWLKNISAFLFQKPSAYFTKWFTSWVNRDAHI